MATGYGTYMAMPLMRASWRPDMTEEEARCVPVLCFAHVHPFELAELSPEVRPRPQATPQRLHACAVLPRRAGLQQGSIDLACSPFCSAKPHLLPRLLAHSPSLNLLRMPFAARCHPRPVARAQYLVGKVTAGEGVSISEPFQLDTKWDYKLFVDPNSSALDCLARAAAAAARVRTCGVQEWSRARGCRRTWHVNVLTGAT